MKRILSILLMLLLACSVCTAEPAPDTINAYVSITDGNGALVMACESISVTDADADGLLTLNDALLCAHMTAYENGAEGYAFSATEFGLSLNKLWGVENGGAYGYYLNDASAWSLLDPVQEGDHVKAYVYTDLMAWSDTYAFFDALHVEGVVGTPLVLTLSAAGYDAAFNPVTLPVTGAVITVNGEATDIATDAEGKAVITLDAAGQYTISATSDSQTLVAPVCILTLSAQ